MNPERRAKPILERPELWPAKIYVARHGESAWNRTKRVSGQLDPPLAEEGFAQANALDKALGGEELTGIYTSTLTRAVDTARPTAHSHNLEIHQYDDLREQHLGIAQGRFRDERDPEIQALWKQRKADFHRFRIPGGETFRDLEARALGCLKRILTQETAGVILIVAHRNTNRALLGGLLNWSDAEIVNAKLRSRHLYEILPGSTPAVHTIHLSGTRACARTEGFLF